MHANTEYASDILLSILEGHLRASGLNYIRQTEWPSIIGQFTSHLKGVKSLQHVTCDTTPCGNLLVTLCHADGTFENLIADAMTTNITHCAPSYLN